MKIPTMINAADSATNVFAWALSGLIGLIALGVTVAPFLSLPSRVESNERAIQSINTRLQESDDKLDILICFHRAEFEGKDPTTCSLR